DCPRTAVFGSKAHQNCHSTVIYPSSNGSLTAPKLSASLDGESGMHGGFWIMAGGIALALASAAPATAAESSDCPNGGTLRFGVEPYDTAARLVPCRQQNTLARDRHSCSGTAILRSTACREGEAKNLQPG